MDRILPRRDPRRLDPWGTAGDPSVHADPCAPSPAEWEDRRKVIPLTRRSNAHRHPEVYAEMLDRAKNGSFAYPAINITSSQTVTAAIRGFAEAGSDGIIQVSTGGAEYASGSTIRT